MLNQSSKKYTREQITYAAWFKGHLKYKLHKAQKIIDQKYEESNQKLFVGNCSRQWGKSFWAVVRSQMQARKYPRSQIRYGAAFQSDLVDFIIPAFQKIEEDCPEILKSKYLKSGSRIVFHNGSVIKLVGLDKNPNGLRGNTLDLIILDEVGFTSHLDYIYKSIVIPATMHRPKAKIIMISTPPSTPAHDFCDYVQKAQLEGGYAEFTIDQNPLIDEDTREIMIRESGGISSTTVQREYYCKFVVDSDLCIIPEWKDSFIQETPKDEFFFYYHKYVAMDLGRKDHTAVIFGYYDFRKAALVIEDEITFAGADWTTETLKEGILDKEHSLWGEDQKTYRRISDNNNEHLIVDLRLLHGVSFIMTDKESLEAMINEVRLMVGNGRVLIDPKCKMLIGCLQYGVWDLKRKEFSRSKVYGHFDMLAALVYLIRNLSKNVNPVPMTHGHEYHRSWIPKDIDKSSGNAKTIKQMFKKR